MFGCTLAVESHYKYLDCSPRAIPMCNTLIYPVNEKGCQNIKALTEFGAFKVVSPIQNILYAIF